MAISNFTDFLGKEVSFIYSDDLFTSRSESEHYVKKVVGTVSGVCIYNHGTSSNFLSDTEFLIKENDEFYAFKDVTFIDTLPNPLDLYFDISN